jgi:hypothetical protein
LTLEDYGFAWNTELLKTLPAKPAALYLRQFRDSASRDFHTGEKN